MIDEKATRNKVDEFLSKYHNIRRLAGQAVFSTLESAINSEVRLTKDNHLAKDLIERKNKYVNLLNDVHHALSMMPSSEANLLFKVYIIDLTFSITELSNSMNISRNTFYRRKNKAMIYFSESFQGGELIVFNENKM